MENDNRKKSIVKRIAAILTSAFLIFSHGDADSNKELPANSKKPEVTVEDVLNDKKNYYNLAKHYPDLEETAEEVISLNDMLSISVGGEVCDTMVPQGLAFKDDMIFVTAYDGIDGYKGDLLLHSYRKANREKLAEEKDHIPHNSVLIVMNRNTREILTTIELPDKNHVGGIAIDDENLYIAKSMDRQISVISLDKIRDAIEMGEKTGIKTAKVFYDYGLPCACDASFVSIRNKDDGKKQLVVGTWIPFPSSSTIRLFDFDDNNQIKLNQKFNTNSSANGAAFIKRDGKEYFVVAASMGRALDSNVFVYEVSEDKEGKIILEPKSQSEFPPMVEEVAEYETESGERKIAINTEAFSKRYEIGRNSVIANGIIVTDLDLMLDKKGRTKSTNSGIPFDIYKSNDIEIEEDNEKER